MQAKIHGADTGATLIDLAVGDRLRQALGQELHDGLGQLLVGASLLTRGLLDGAPSEFKARVERLATLLEHANRVTHDLATGWSPWLGHEGSASQRILELSRRTSETFGIVCQTELGDVLDEMDEEAGVQLFLLVREAVTNALRHSGCSALSISAGRQGSLRKLWVRDDGSTLSNAKVPSGFGIRSMRARACALGGALELTTSIGTGLEVCCTW